MTFVQARNAIVAGLEAHIGCPVNLSEQIADIPEFPYCYYSVLAPRIPKYSFGLREIVETAGEPQLIRSEQVSATMSFTFCSTNRETDDGYIFGEDEALELAEKANGFFLLNAHNIQTEYGEVVVENVGSVSSRSRFFVEDTIRRYGFDVRFSYVRTDTMPATLVERPGNPIGEVKP